MRDSLTAAAVRVPISLVLTALLMTCSALGASPATYRLEHSRTPGQIDRIAVLLEVDGKIIGPNDEPDDREQLSVIAHLNYDERTLGTSPDANTPSRSIRHYDKATAVLKVGQTELKPTLRPQRCLIGVDIDAPTVTLFSPGGTLTRKELELIDVLGNSLLLDRFLPDKAVAVGQKWKHSDELMAALLDLDAIAEADVSSELIEVTGDLARLQMTGHVKGAVEGVSTEIDIKAKYRFDRRTKRIDWFAILVKENRGVSRVGDGWEAVARLQIQISPVTESEHLSDAALKGLVLQAKDAPEQLAYTSTDGKWELTYDRRWHVCRDREDLAILRLLDRGNFVAQCNMSTMPKAPIGKPVPMTEFQSDVQSALGASFGEFVEAGQRANEAGYRVYRVVVRGKVADLAIQWNYYLVADELGRQVTFAFTVEGDLIEQLGDGDRRLVNSLRFVDSKGASQ